MGISSCPFQNGVASDARFMFAETAVFIWRCICKLLNAAAGIRCQHENIFYLGVESVNIYPDKAAFVRDSTSLLFSREKFCRHVFFTDCSLQ